MFSKILEWLYKVVCTYQSFSKFCRGIEYKFSKLYRGTKYFQKLQVDIKIFKNYARAMAPLGPKVGLPLILCLSFSP